MELKWAIFHLLNLCQRKQRTPSLLPQLRSPSFWSRRSQTCKSISYWSPGTQPRTSKGEVSHLPFFKCLLLTHVSTLKHNSWQILFFLGELIVINEEEQYRKECKHYPKSSLEKFKSLTSRPNSFLWRLFSCFKSFGKTINSCLSLYPQSTFKAALSHALCWVVYHIFSLTSCRQHHLC